MKTGAESLQVRSVVMHVYALVSQKKTVALFLSPDSGCPFDVLDTRQVPVRRRLTGQLDSLIGVYGPGLQPGWVMEDLEAMGVVVK